MLKRLITAAITIAVVIPILVFSDTWAFPCAIAFVGVISIFEMARCMGVHKKIAMTAPLYIYALVFPFLLRAYENDFYVAGIAIMAIVFYVAYMFAWVIFSHGKLKYNDVCAICLTAFYILFALNMILYIRDYKNGEYIYLLVIVGACVTDTFAYFVGRFFGRHKLAPDVSPKKTVEGAIGGVVFCALSFVLMGFIIAQTGAQITPNYIYLAVSGIIISVISQAGDLIMSSIKRQYGIKDFGNILPGHGGILDRIDSILSVSLGVVSMIMFSYITNITLF